MHRITDDKHPKRGFVEVYDAVADALVYWPAATARENLAYSNRDANNGKGRRYWAHKPDVKDADAAQQIAAAKEAAVAETREKSKREGAKATVEVLEARNKALADEIKESRKALDDMGAKLDDMGAKLEAALKRLDENAAAPPAAPENDAPAPAKKTAKK